MPRARHVVPVVLLAAAAMLWRAPFMIDAAPAERTMGLISKIIYYHVASAITMMISAFVCGIACVQYVRRRTAASDRVAMAAAELAVVFGLITLLTGPLWARKAWGVWWVWGEMRLTLTLVMWMVFVAYGLLRRFGGPGSELMTAVVGIFGMALGPFVYYSVKLWRTLHPTTDVTWTLPPEMRTPFLWSWAAFTLLYIALLLTRVLLERNRARVDEALIALED